MIDHNHDNQVQQHNNRTRILEVDSSMKTKIQENHEWTISTVAQDFHSTQNEPLHPKLWLSTKLIIFFVFTLTLRRWCVPSDGSSRMLGRVVMEFPFDAEMKSKIVKIDLQLARIFGYVNLYFSDKYSSYYHYLITSTLKEYFSFYGEWITD